VTSAPSSASSTDAPSFRDLGVAKKLNDALYAQGMISAFPIQAASLPATLEGKDLCGRAPTGSGKTLAFAIPVVENTARGCDPHHPGALLMAPTRELANQIHDTILPLAKARGKYVAAFYGGTSVKRDINRLKRGVDIVVGTPGRLEDLVKQGQLKLDEVRVVVLDEADRMADMGFLPVVKKLLDKTNSERQTLLFSATLDGDVDVLVRRYQHNPVKVEIDESEEEQGDVRHLFWQVDRGARKQVTADVLKRSGSTIVFTRTKRGADRLAKQLANSGLTTAAIHGNRSQNQRERALSDFSSGRVTALIATDVAARGIHVDDVDTVLHYDLPATDKDYVHRSGRTGRAGRDGVVVSLVAEDQGKDLRDLQKGLEGHSGTHRLDLDAVTVAGGKRLATTSRSERPAEEQGGGQRQQSRSSSSNGNSNRNRSNGSGNGNGGGRSRSGGPKGGARSSNRRRRSS
jgi:superfamily II DNA/RNA helicase